MVNFKYFDVLFCLINPAFANLNITSFMRALAKAQVYVGQKRVSFLEVFLPHSFYAYK